MLVYFMSFWSILRPLEILYGHLVNFVVIWYILPRFGMLYQEKSGNPEVKATILHSRVVGDHLRPVFNFAHMHEM
jgi:hypothetical protein